MLIQKLIQQGTALTECSDYNKAKEEFFSWSQEVRRTAAFCRLSEETQEILNVKLHFHENEYSTEDSMVSLRRAVEETNHILEMIDATENDDFSEGTELLILEKILSNFYMHIKAMYRMDVHGSGTIKKADLDKIIIGNEYDVQRILYSLIVPVFPEARTEVNADNGYGGVRTDIYLGHNNIAIEIKCTRKHMTEKDLTEQLGADDFHYPVNTLFMFIYDQGNIIKNVPAFEKAFRREPGNGIKRIRVIIIQPVNL